MKSTTTKLRLICEFPFMNMPLRRLTGLVAALSIFMGIDVVADPVLITEKVNDSAPYGILETTPDAWWADIWGNLIGIFTIIHGAPTETITRCADQTRRAVRQKML